MDNSKALIDDRYFLFFDQELKNIGATYISFLAFNNDNDVVYSKSNNPDWVYEFTSSGLYKNCHLLREASKKMLNDNESSFCLSWDFYEPQTEEEKNLDEIRKIKNITHGVGFCIKSNKYNLLLNIAGKHSDINFGLNVLKNRASIYKVLQKSILENPFCR